MTVLVTGAAGFIGYHVCQRLLDRGDRVVGVDCINDYYDPAVKHARLARLDGKDGFTFVKADIADRAAMAELAKSRPDIDRYINLAAQAGVRHSLNKPFDYTHANVEGHLTMLELARFNDRVRHFVYASSSSVYGSNSKQPFSVEDRVDTPISLYAATKRAGELMSHAYSHLFRVPTTGLRFFTVYGPWGRPDMALFLFTKAILEGRPIDVFNHGKMRRDFTYIDDIVEGVVRVCDRIPTPNPAWSGDTPDPGTSYAPFRIYNIGNNSPVELLHFIETLEKQLGKSAVKNLLPLQAGDVPATCADVDDLMNDVGFKPATPIEEGIKRFVEWYRGYYRC